MIPKCPSCKAKAIILVDTIDEHKQNDKVIIPARAIVKCKNDHIWYVPLSTIVIEDFS